MERFAQSIKIRLRFGDHQFIGAMFFSGLYFSEICEQVLVAVLSWWKSFIAFEVFPRFLPSNVSIISIIFCYWSVFQDGWWILYHVRTKIRKPSPCYQTLAFFVVLVGFRLSLSTQLSMWLRYSGFDPFFIHCHIPRRKNPFDVA